MPMNKNKVVVFAMLFVLPLCVRPYEFPANFKRCHLTDSNLDSCLKSAIQNAIHLFTPKGIPSLHLRSVDPMELDYMTIEQGTSVKLKQVYRDVKTYGISNGTVENAHFDVNAKKLTFTIAAPKLQQKAKYEMSGKILILPIYGKGESVITIYNATVINQLRFKEESRGKDVYFILKSFKVKTSVQNVEYMFSNLFNGEKLLADNVHRLLNDQAVELYKDVSQWIDKGYGYIMYNATADFFKNIPVKDIFIQ